MSERAGPATTSDEATPIPTTPAAPEADTDGRPGGRTGARSVRSVVHRLPLIGLSFALVVFAAPLGLWMIGLQDLLALAAGGRDYVLSVASVGVVYLLALVAVLRRGGDTPLSYAVTVTCVGLVAAVWTAIGVADHGLAQTLVGLRLTLLPLALFVAVSALGRDDVRRLLSVVAWLVIANAVASIGEIVVGPARLVRWGFEEDRAVRYIDGVFRVPGLTEFNAELGMFAGAYLLGYAALWLTSGARPRRWVWHAGALAAVVCLALSTSRSGAVLVAAGVVAAVLLDRSRSRARKRVTAVVAGVLLLGVAGGFVLLGASGASSLTQRFEVWADLLRGVPLFGGGIGSAGAATYSRVADTEPRFVDNYFLSVGLQFGPIAMVALIGLVGWALVALTRRSARRPTDVVAIAVLAGLAAASLFIESWEYAATMATLVVFVVHAERLAAEHRPRSLWTDAGRTGRG